MKEVFPAEDPASNSWHVDKRVPVALIFTLLFQGSIGIWWGSQISARVAALEESRLELRNNPDRITRLETALSAVQRTVEKIDLKMDRVLSTPRGSP